MSSAETKTDTSTNGKPKSNGQTVSGKGPPAKLDLVIELRTHGVSGTTPESILDVPRVAWCDGGDRNRFFCAADHLSNPDHTGPPLDVDGAPVDRERLGYHWGRMTSGGLRQAMWAILIPFALNNMAIWMLPPTTTNRASRPAVIVARAAVRVAGLLLTVLFMSQAAVIVVDMLGAQCLARGSTCLDWFAPANWLREHPLPRALLVAAVLVIPAVGVGLITKDAIRDTPSEAGTRADAQAQATLVDGAGTPPLRPRLADDDYYAFSNSRSALRTLHGIAAFAAATIVLTGGISFVGTAVLGLIGLALLVIAVGFTAWLDDPNGTGGNYSRGGDHRKLFEGSAGISEVGVSVFVLIAAAALVLPGRFEHASFGVALGGTSDVVLAVVVGLMVAWIVLLIALIIATGFATRRYWGKYPKPYRPWLGGLHPAVFVGLAVTVGIGFGVGAAQTTQNCVAAGCRPQFTVPQNVPKLAQPPFYDAITREWGFMALVLVSASVFVAGLCWFRRRSNHVKAGRLLQFKDTPAARTPPSWCFARLNQWAHFTALAVFASAIVGILVAPWTPHWFAGLGVFLLGLALVSLLGVIYNAYRRPDTAGRSLGVLWDLASFWPREGHPIVPPPYSRQAVKDLTAKTKELLDQHPRALILLCGHSQGSLLMYATVLRLRRDPTVQLDRIGLLTYGSQLQWAYGRAFPDYLGYASHRELLRDLGGRWKNLIRFTDAVGGPVLSWGLEPDKEAVAVTATTPTPAPAQSTEPKQDAQTDSEVRKVTATVSQVLLLGDEYWLPDPSLEDPRYPSRGHSDYPASKQWDLVIAAVYEAALKPPG